MRSMQTAMLGPPASGQPPWLRSLPLRRKACLRMWTPAGEAPHSGADPGPGNDSLCLRACRSRARLHDQQTLRNQQIFAESDAVAISAKVCEINKGCETSTITACRGLEPCIDATERGSDAEPHPLLTSRQRHWQDKTQGQTGKGLQVPVLCWQVGQRQVLVRQRQGQQHGGRLPCQP